jgi:alanine dehydrogenase
MDSEGTLLLKRSDVANLLSIGECITSVEHAFKLYASGDARPPGILGIPAEDGGFHIKAGIMNLRKKYFAAKINANFPGNDKYRLPTIQGVIAVLDAEKGKLLALMDSIEITILRTGAATAVAAKYLAKTNAKKVSICGSGNQGKISLRAIKTVRSIEEVSIFDIDRKKAEMFAHDLSTELNIPIHVATDPERAVHESDICVTCTSSKKPILFRKFIAPGTFVAAVGSDSEEKQELEPSLLTVGKLVTDITAQCALIGELHHGIEAGVMKKSDVYAELGQIITGEKPGRESNEEIIIFDSTGSALQDIVSAAVVYEKAIAQKRGTSLFFHA